MNIDRLQELCKSRGIIYDGAEPTELSPGVYQFYGTPLTDVCRHAGDCHQYRYYAIELGDHTYIQRNI